MTNAENNNSERANDGGTAAANKQAILVTSSVVKKVALRDVQNQNIGSAHGQSENLSFLGGTSNKDASFKMCGNKRLTPEPPSAPPTLIPTLSNTCGNELIMNAWKRFELELGGGRIQNNVKHFDTSRSKPLQVESPQKNIHPKSHTQNSLSTSVSRNTSQPLTKPYRGSSAPNFPKKQGSGLQAVQTDSVKVSIDCPDSSTPTVKGTDDKKRVERITRLEKFLKGCDETNIKDYYTMLRHLSPYDLNKRAIELEKRSIRLSIEEVKEVQRMKVLNVLEMPLSSNDHSHTLQLMQAKN